MRKWGMDQLEEIKGRCREALRRRREELDRKRPRRWKLWWIRRQMLQLRRELEEELVRRARKQDR